MYKVKAFKEINAVLGILKGELSADELNTFGNDVVRTIENKLQPGFTYLLDVSKYKKAGESGEAKSKMEEIEFFLSKMGLKNILVIGEASSYLSGEDKDNIVLHHFPNLDEAINFLSEKRKEE